MDYKEEPKKRVTKNDKKSRKEVYSQKHIRIRAEMLERREKNGPVPTSK
jgi:hypothetical protein